MRLALGSDVWGDTSVGEARSLLELGVFDTLALLNLWCEATPAAIFPGRPIGKLADGYEASFLVLAGNPLEDFGQVGEIVLRFKQGERLRLPGE